jgi:PPP family 3-phenylpropionic acid transporter
MRRPDGETFLGEMSGSEMRHETAETGVEGGLAQSFGLRVALFYGALFLIYGVHVPYLPLWLDWRGLTSTEIALVMSSPFFLRLLITPIVALKADRSGNHRRTIMLIAWAALALALLLSGAETFWPIFLFAVPFHVAAATIMPLTETIAVRGVRVAGLDYGRMRLWGSLTFIGIGLFGGALADAYGPAICIYTILAGAAATAFAAHLLPADSPEQASRGTKPQPLFGDEAKSLVRSPVFLMFLAGVAAVQASHGTFYSFGALHWKSLGLSTSWTGALWAIAVLSEVALFAYASQLSERTGPLDLVLVGALAGIVRWGVMAFDPPLWLLAPLQGLHAFTYGASHLGAMQFIARAVPTRASGTAQALYSVMAAGCVIGAVTLASGAIYPAAGGLAYLLPAALSVFGATMTLLLKRRWAGGTV